MTKSKDPHAQKQPEAQGHEGSQNVVGLAAVFVLPFVVIGVILALKYLFGF